VTSKPWKSSAFCSSLVLGLLLFFFISSYHFGESQLFKFEIKNKLISHISYLFWGASVIFSFFFYNIEELVILSNSYEDTRNLLSNINLGIACGSAPAQRKIHIT